MTSRGQTSGCDTLIVFGPCYWCLGGHRVKFWARSEVSLKSKKCCQKVDLVTFADLWRPNRWVWHPNSCWYAVLVSWRMLCVNFSSFWGVPNMGWIWAERGLSMGCLDGHDWDHKYLYNLGESGYSSVTFSFIVHSSDTCHAEKPETWPRIGWSLPFLTTTKNPWYLKRLRRQKCKRHASSNVRGYPTRVDSSGRGWGYFGQLPIHQ